MHCRVLPTWAALLLTGLLPASAAESLIASTSGLPVKAAAGDESFIELDNYFVKKYGQTVASKDSQPRPVLVVTGFAYNLVMPDGTVKSQTGTLPRLPELKAVAHMGACLFAIGSEHWNNPTSSQWKADLTQLLSIVRACATTTDKMDWSSEAWPGGADKLKKFVHQALDTVDSFCVEMLESGDFSRQAYERFATKYTPAMISTFYLTNLGSAFATLKVLNEWKAEVGTKTWEQMYFVIAGSQGRPTAGLTPETNPVAVTIAATLPADYARTRMIIAPTANTLDEALESLGHIVAAGKLADAAFVSAEARKAGGFYQALKSSDQPLALYDIRTIVSQLKAGTAKDPILGIGP